MLKIFKTKLGSAEAGPETVDIPEGFYINKVLGVTAEFVIILIENLESPVGSFTSSSIVIDPSRAVAGTFRG